MNFRKESKMNTIDTRRKLNVMPDDPLEIFEGLSLGALIHIANNDPAHINYADPRTDEQRDLDEWQAEARDVGFGTDGRPM
jgi:hypothetical protein